MGHCSSLVAAKSANGKASKGLLCFPYLRMSLFYLQREWVFLHVSTMLTAIFFSTVAQNGQTKH